MLKKKIKRKKELRNDASCATVARELRNDASCATVARELRNKTHEFLVYPLNVLSWAPVAGHQKITQSASIRVAMLSSFASAPVGTIFTADVKQQQVLWHDFKTTFAKSYSTQQEEERRFGVFLDFLKIADQRNAKDPHATHGVTQFSDLTQAEFNTKFLNYRPGGDKGATIVGAEKWPPMTDTGIGVKQDWTGKYTTPIKDQGDCGSCWAFSATEQVESDAIRTLGRAIADTKLSTQQVISCDLVDGGCDGGNTDTAYDYLKHSKGAVHAVEYPDTSHITGNTGVCARLKLAKPAIKLTGHSKIRGVGTTEHSMATCAQRDPSAAAARAARPPAAGELHLLGARCRYVNSTGPLSICVDAEDWNSYRGGVLTGCGMSIDHCVQIVGIDTTGAGVVHPPYWKARHIPRPRGAE